MGLGTNFTQYCVNQIQIKGDPQAYEDVRCGLIGNTFHAGTVALLLAPLLEGLGYIDVRPPPQEIVGRLGLTPGEVYRPGTDCSLGREPPFSRFDGRRRDRVAANSEEAVRMCDPRSNAQLESQLFHATLRAADYRGSDVRLDTGELLRPHAWPRRSLDTARYVWHSVLAARYSREEHINVLELKANLLHLRWRLRAKKRMGSRFLHLLDSQVCLGVLTKGRSSSWRLNRVLNRCNSLTLAAGLFPLYGYVRSDWNTSDRPSRTWAKKKPPAAKSFPKRKSPSRVRGKTAKGHNKRNRKFPKDFDSTCGYPGEGPGKQKSRSRVRLALRGRVISRRTQVERALERRGVLLKWATLAPITGRLYKEAVKAMWEWLGRPPPDYVQDVVAFDALLAEYILYGWEIGLTRVMAGNTLSGSTRAWPEIKLKIRSRLSNGGAFVVKEGKCNASS